MTKSAPNSTNSAAACAPAGIARLPQRRRQRLQAGRGGRTSDPEIKPAKKFLGVGLQTAAGVPLPCDEGADFHTFRIGLFGLDKLHDPARTVESNLAEGLDKVLG